MGEGRRGVAGRGLWVEEESTGAMESNRDPWPTPAHLPTFISCPLPPPPVTKLQPHCFPLAKLLTNSNLLLHICLPLILQTSPDMPAPRKGFGGPYTAPWLSGWPCSSLTTCCRVPPSHLSPGRCRCLFSRSPSVLSPGL